MPIVAVIIVNWNGKDDTIACLKSITKLTTHNSQLTTIVVDNGSIDDSVSFIRKQYPKVEVLEAGENLGFTGGNNVGIRWALAKGSDFVWLLNNDTIVGKNSLFSLVDLCKKTGCDIAGSKIYFTPGHEYHKSRYVKSDRGKVFWYAGGHIDWGNMYASHRGVDEVDQGQYDDVEETPFVTGCSMIVKREVFEKIGLLDEKFFAYLEDLDFCLRAKSKGFRLVYVPRSIVWHNNAGSSGVGSSLHQYYMTRNRMMIGMRYAPVRTKFALVREAIRTLISGSPIVKRAVGDWFLGRFGASR